LQSWLDSQYNKDCVSAKIGSIQYLPTEMSARITLHTLSESGTTKEADDFNRLALIYGLKKEQLGTEFTSGFDRDNVYIVAGLLPRSTKYPILATRKSDGKQFKFPVGAILLGTKQ